MCGIAGIVGRIDDAHLSALGRMNHAMVHRGPDGEGVWTAEPDSRGWGAMLGHRRLSILDLTPAAAQPMVDPVTGHVIVLNGEIYNFVELRDRLIAAGQQFRSTGDTAVMVRALGVHGHSALGWLRGMFAFGLWDPSSRELVLARDPLGIKPLYLARNPDPGGSWSLVFASEVRAILASGLLGRPRLNPLATASALWSGFMVTPETAIAGIESVWPGEVRTFGPQGKEVARRQYWNIPNESDAPPIGEAELALALENCVRLHLASDVPLGVFLSGGIDSSAIANLARKASSTPVSTFTLAFDEQEYSEGLIAKRVAAAIGTRHQEVVLTERHFVARLDDALNSLDQPTFDGINSYYMARAVREAGFKVALVGSGGDELFGGYSSFRELPALVRWSTRVNWIPKALRVAVAQVVASAMQPSRPGAFPRQVRWAKLPAMAESGGNLLSLYQLAYALFLPTSRRLLLADNLADALVDGLPAAMHSRLSRETQSRPVMSAVGVMEQRLFLGERLLRDTDAASMASSIEVRLPLVDQVLLENVYRLPERLKYHPLGMKSILRRTGLRGLDESLFNRPKAGFVLPFDRWIRSRLGKTMDQTFRDSAVLRSVGLRPEGVERLWQAFRNRAPGLYWSRIWAIYAFVRWCQMNDARL